MTVQIIGKARQGDGTQHIEAKAPAGTAVVDVIDMLIKKAGYHDDVEGWGEVKDDSRTDVWTYMISITP